MTERIKNPFMNGSRINSKMEVGDKSDDGHNCTPLLAGNLYTR